MPLERIVQKHIIESFRNPRQKNLHRNFRKRYNVKGQTRNREVQFLRPQIYCYAFPDYFSTVPSSQPQVEYITARITNAGGAVSTNTIVQINRYDQAGSSLASANKRISLQPGQTRELRFGFSALPGAKVARYRLASYDPLHDPLTQQSIEKAKTIQCLSNALEPKQNTNSEFEHWNEWTRLSNGDWQPASSPTWSSRTGLPNPGTVSLQRNKRYFATSGQTPRSGSQLRQIVPVSALSLDNATTGLLQRGEIRASIDAMVYLHSGVHETKGWIEVDFVDAAGASLSAFRSPSPANLNQWTRINGSIATPPSTAEIIFKMIADRPSNNAIGQVYFDQLYLQLAPRNVFASGRIYSF